LVIALAEKNVNKMSRVISCKLPVKLRLINIRSKRQFVTLFHKTE